MLKGWLLFLVGGGLYVSMEFFWRGRSHISMFITGGAALALIGGLAMRFENWPMWLMCLACTVVITALEFIAGAVVNVKLGLGVWDYGGLPLNVYGQICLPYMLLWYGLSAVGIFIARVVAML